MTDELDAFYIRDPTFPIIKNKNNFVIGKHTYYNPRSQAFINYWRLHKKRCIEGFWSIDDPEYHIDVNNPVEPIECGKKWRFMPPNLYFYVNFGVIKHKPEGSQKTDPKKIVRPYLRDFEWAYFYNFIEARGFSGFSDDDEYTCLEAVDKFEKNEILEDDADLQVESIYKKDGSLKKYIPARQYLRQLFDKPMGIPLYENQSKNMMLLGARGGGKGTLLTEVVPTPDGMKVWGSLQIGDYVFDENGNPTKIIGIPFDDITNTYEITFSDGRKTIVSEDHLWNVKCWDKGFKVIDTKTIASDYVKKRKVTERNPNGKEYKYKIQVSGAVEFNKKEDLLIDPYTMGLLIGDGSFRNVHNHTMFLAGASEDIDEYREIIPYHIDELSSKDNNVIHINNIKEILKKYDLLDKYSYEKHIPYQYLFSSKEDRLNLLKGLIDTDGTVTKSRGTPSYTTTSEQLADDVCFLARSLGYNCRKSKKENVGYKDKDGNFVHCRDCYNVYIYTDDIICNLKRKIAKIQPRTSNYHKSKQLYSIIVDVKCLGPQHIRCISVENESGLYLTNDFIVTHNSYLTGVGVVLHEWLFDGARIYNKESIENPSVVEILVGAANTAKSKDILDKTELALNNLAGPGGYTKHPFYKEHMGTLKSNNINNAFRNEYLKKISGEWVKKGSMSNIKHVTFTVTNPEAAAGTRPNIIVVEEVGLLENVLQVHASNEATMVTDGTNRFGTTVYIGTGGNMDKIVESEILFRDPEANTLLAFDDIYENSGKIGWFVPAYYMDGSYKDENGNTKIKEAVDHYMKRREIKRKAKSMKAIDGELTNYPLKPSEMFSSNNSNIFPINDLKERLIEIQTQSYKEADKTLVCELGIDSNGSVFTYPVDSNKVIRNFPALKSMDLDGAVEIYEEPKKDSEGNVFMNRYYAGCLTPGEKVLTNHGLKNVEDINNDDLLLNKDGEFVSINKFLKFYKEQEDVYEFKVSNIFRTTKFTKEHPIYVSDRITKYNTKSNRQRQYEFNFDFKTADLVKEGQWTKSPNIYRKETNDYLNLNFNKKILKDKDFWWLIGLWLGDGWTDKYSIYFSFNSKETTHINKAKSIVQRLFNKNTYERIRNNCVELSFGNKKLSEFLNDYFGKYAYGKKINESIKYAPHKLKKQLILGYLDSDGCIIEKNNRYSSSFVSINLELLESIQDILFSLNIVSNLSKLRNKKESFIQEKKVNQKETYQLRLGHFDVLKLRSLFDEIDDLKLSKVNINKYNKRPSPTSFECFIKDGFIYNKIKKITKSKYTGYVYNFDCKTHTFISYYITTHNCDTYDDDKVVDTISLGSIFIMDSWTRRIVAEYTGRRLTKDFYEITRRLTMYYNAVNNYEQNKKGLFSYYEKVKSLYLLAETPKSLKDEAGSSIIRTGNRKYGTTTTTAVINYGINLILNWLLEEAYGEDANISNVFKIKSKGLLEELIKYNPKHGNYDRIFALIMLLILVEDRHRIIDEQINNMESSKQSVEQDEFFSRNYDRKYKSMGIRF
jgi:intein/homing endonuclease